MDQACIADADAPEMRREDGQPDTRFRGERPALDPRLQVWLSPSFPIGGFAYSHGLELAAERGWVVSRQSLEAWLRDLIEVGSIRNDCIILAATWRAARTGDRCSLREINDLAVALQPSAERHLESVTQGGAFLSTMGAAWSVPGLDILAQALGEDVALPVAVGVSSAAHDIALEGTLTAFAIAAVGNLISAAIRLSVVGQTDGQRVMAACVTPIERIVSLACASRLDDVGGVALRSDLASMMHETQYSRLFRS